MEKHFEARLIAMEIAFTAVLRHSGGMSMLAEIARLADRAENAALYSTMPDEVSSAVIETLRAFVKGAT
jgi:hypothetical protein